MHFLNIAALGRLLFGGAAVVLRVRRDGRLPLALLPSRPFVVRLAVFCHYDDLLFLS